MIGKYQITRRCPGMKQAYHVTRHPDHTRPTYLYKSTLCPFPHHSVCKSEMDDHLVPYRLGTIHSIRQYGSSRPCSSVNHYEATILSQTP